MATLRSIIFLRKTLLQHRHSPNPTLKKLKMRLYIFPFFSYSWRMYRCQTHFPANSSGSKRTQGGCGKNVLIFVGICRCWFYSCFPFRFRFRCPLPEYLWTFRLFNDSVASVFYLFLAISFICLTWLWMGFLLTCQHFGCLIILTAGMSLGPPFLRQKNRLGNSKDNAGRSMPTDWPVIYFDNIGSIRTYWVRISALFTQVKIDLFAELSGKLGSKAFHNEMKSSFKWILLCQCAYFHEISIDL